MFQCQNYKCSKEEIYIVVKLRHWAFIRCHMFIRKFFFVFFYEYIAP